MSYLTQIVVWLNSFANVLGQYALAPLAAFPDRLDWLSATVTGAVTGLLFLLAFKYTSNQRAIKRVKDNIKANLLAIKLFKDNARVAVSAQQKMLSGSGRLLTYSLVPMLVMMVPALLILGQLALWYQARPLRVGEEAVVTVKLKPDDGSTQPNIELEPISGVENLAGPVRVRSKHEVCWNLRANHSGYHQLVFRVGQQSGSKELAIGDGFMRVSKLRPSWDWFDTLVNPWEKPFDADSPIQAIEIEYPDRSSWTDGTWTWKKIWTIMTFGFGSWIIYWFVVSMIAGLCLRRPFNVNI